MDFLKRHYEKVLLGVVLVGLAVGAALLPWMITNKRDSERAKADEIINRPIKALPTPDLRVTNSIAQAATPMALDFSTDHKLFNPVLWRKMPDGTWKKITRGNEIGIEAVGFTKFSPLYTIITLESVMTTESGTRYMISVTREAAVKLADRTKKTTGASINEKNKEGFTIREVKGPPDNPADLILELTDTAERASVNKSKPFKRVDGYKADLKCPPGVEVRNAGMNQYVRDRIRIAKEDYIIVAIATNEVVFSAPSGKKTSRPYNPGP